MEKLIKFLLFASSIILIFGILSYFLIFKNNDIVLTEEEMNILKNDNYENNYYSKTPKKDENEETKIKKRKKYKSLETSEIIENEILNYYLNIFFILFTFLFLVPIFLDYVKNISERKAENFYEEKIAYIDLFCRKRDINHPFTCLLSILCNLIVNLFWWCFLNFTKSFVFSLINSFFYKNNLGFFKGLWKTFVNFPGKKISIIFLIELIIIILDFFAIKDEKKILSDLYIYVRDTIKSAKKTETENNSFVTLFR